MKRLDERQRCQRMLWIRQLGVQKYHQLLVAIVFAIVVLVKDVVVVTSSVIAAEVFFCPFVTVGLLVHGHDLHETANEAAVGAQKSTHLPDGA